MSEGGGLPAEPSQALIESAFFGPSKQYVRWDTGLHEVFEAAVEALGGPHAAKPALIRERMGIPLLTTAQVKSHLQKYRIRVVAEQGAENATEAQARAAARLVARQKRAAAEASGAASTAPPVQRPRVKVPIRGSRQATASASVGTSGGSGAALGGGGGGGGGGGSGSGSKRTSGTGSRGSGGAAGAGTGGAAGAEAGAVERSSRIRRKRKGSGSLHWSSGEDDDEDAELMLMEMEMEGDERGGTASMTNSGYRSGGGRDGEGSLGEVRSAGTSASPPAHGEQQQQGAAAAAAAAATQQQQQGASAVHGGRQRAGQQASAAAQQAQQAPPPDPLSFNELSQRLSQEGMSLDPSTVAGLASRGAGMAPGALLRAAMPPGAAALPGGMPPPLPPVSAPPLSASDALAALNRQVELEQALLEQSIYVQRLAAEVQDLRNRQHHPAEAGAALHTPFAAVANAAFPAVPEGSAAAAGGSGNPNAPLTVDSGMLRLLSTMQESWQRHEASGTLAAMLGDTDAASAAAGGPNAEGNSAVGNSNKNTQRGSGGGGRGPRGATSLLTCDSGMLRMLSSAAPELWQRQDGAGGGGPDGARRDELSAAVAAAAAALAAESAAAGPAGGGGAGAAAGLPFSPEAWHQALLAAGQAQVAQAAQAQAQAAPQPKGAGPPSAAGPAAAAAAPGPIAAAPLGLGAGDAPRMQLPQLPPGVNNRQTSLEIFTNSLVTLGLAGNAPGGAGAGGVGGVGGGALPAALPWPSLDISRLFSLSDAVDLLPPNP